jgi:membrane protein
MTHASDQSRDPAFPLHLSALSGKVYQWLWTSQPRHMPFHKKTLWALLRISYIVVNEYRKDRISLRASALTFTIVLSLVPTLALGTAVLKGLGAGDQMRSAVYQFIDQLDQSGTFSAPGPTSTEKKQDETIAPPENLSGKGEPQDLTSHLRKAADTIFNYVERTNFAALGAFGIAGVVFAVLSVLGNIETSMNAIWRADSNRPFGRKVIDYLSLMILLPVSANLTLAAEAILQSPTLFLRIQQVIPIFWLQSLLLTMLPIFIVVGTFTLLYRFLPNTQVNFSPALIGGFAGGIGWFALQSFYIKLQIGVARYNAIYGSFATLPLFLVWLYMGWLVFLTGAEVAFAIQNWRQYLPEGERMTPLKKMTIAFEAVAAILEGFKLRQVTSKKMLAHSLNRQPGHISIVLKELEEAGIIHHVQEKRHEGYVPAAPSEVIPATEIVSMVMGSPTPGDLHHPLTIRALESALKAVADRKVEVPAHLQKEAEKMPPGITQSELFNPSSQQAKRTAGDQ